MKYYTYDFKGYFYKFFCLIFPFFSMFMYCIFNVHYLHVLGKRILEQAYKQIDSAGINHDTGMHDPDVEEPPPLTPNTAAIIQRLPLDRYTNGE